MFHCFSSRNTVPMASDEFVNIKYAWMRQTKASFQDKNTPSGRKNFLQVCSVWWDFWVALGSPWHFKCSFRKQGLFNALICWKEKGWFSVTCNCFHIRKSDMGFWSLPQQKLNSAAPSEGWLLSFEIHYIINRGGREQDTWVKEGEVR